MCCQEGRLRGFRSVEGGCSETQQRMDAGGCGKGALQGPKETADTLQPTTRPVINWLWRCCQRVALEMSSAFALSLCLGSAAPERGDLISGVRGGWWRVVCLVRALGMATGGLRGADLEVTAGSTRMPLSFRGRFWRMGCISPPGAYTAKLTVFS